MAMSFNENLDDNGEMHEINVTPFIDQVFIKAHCHGTLSYT